MNLTWCHYFWPGSASDSFQEANKNRFVKWAANLQLPRADVALQDVHTLHVGRNISHISVSTGQRAGVRLCVLSVVADCSTISHIVFWQNRWVWGRCFELRYEAELIMNWFNQIFSFCDAQINVCNMSTDWKMPAWKILHNLMNC